ncbi:transcriptional regulator [Staphylococcus piscifermentans]|uniref:Protease synthase and sporulation protein PAI 2 n=1 Tax=Staphylococcus piscifermentans TaxID=70258 RepID=A0A239TQY6_9STAP|nr:FMN-binding negative transcriptional regulator [Staphylococcus piscifermentans]RTX84525.1 FMN-binding negative transcriptional regulator [Staphylococcus piscifermentans]GEP84473.1 protease synthase and sporulation protein PAI 2 [Staphylococcus piscifermentans]SNU98993.1 transcriptional regulator [Staphylococcus piscifermentans]
MYIPKYYQEHNMNKIKAFIHDHPFATIVSTAENGRPLATHLPILIHEDGESLILAGHFAKANPQWHTLEHSDEVLIIFQGPDAYVSSTWYGHEDVPTWDYQSIQVYGQPALLTEGEVKQDLIQLLNRFEKKDGARWDNLSEETLQQIHGVVGFHITVSEVFAAYKLSQNRNHTDYQNIIHHLEDEHNGVADAMKDEQD